MKTKMKQLVTVSVLAFQILAGNVRADGTEAKITLFEENETTLRLEDWMTDETIWNSNSAIFADFVQEAEPKAEIESWMTEAGLWSFNCGFANETEPGLELESWMVEDFTWNKVPIENDSKLSLESWMTNEKIWK